MAAQILLRCSYGTPRLLRSGVLIRVAPLAAKDVTKQSFTVTSTMRERIYGPAEEGMPAITGHWKQERVVSAVLLPLIPAALAFPNVALDMGLSAFLVLHTHWGLTGVLTDYIHGETLKKITNPAVLLLSIVAFAGLCLLNINDVGFSMAVRKIWTEL